MCEYGLANHFFDAVVTTLPVISLEGILEKRK